MRPLAFALALGIAAPAAAASFRLPLDGCDPSTQCLDSNKCYVTVYEEHSGSDWNCGANTYLGHRGTDFGVQGTVGERPVVAAAPGQVLASNDGCPAGRIGSTCGGGLGNFVKLKHADGRVTVYAHLHAGTLKVQQGAQVACGDELGRAGSSGNSTGPHLHFEVVDPVLGSVDPFAGACAGPYGDWVGQGSYCVLPSATCQSACAQQCGARKCGPDGCGGSCGSCSSAQTCQLDGTCGAALTDNSAADVPWTEPGHKQPCEGFMWGPWPHNTGTSTWSRAGDYALACTQGQTFGAPGVVWIDALEKVDPSDLSDWHIPMVAPLAPGSYSSTWKMSHEGKPFGVEIKLSLTVDAPAAPIDAAQLTGTTLEDDSRLGPDAPFTKTWTIRNAGSSVWNTAGNYSLIFERGADLGASGGAQLVAGESVAPGASKTWSLFLHTPAATGTYRGYFRMAHAGQPFGDVMWAQVIVMPVSPDDQDFDGHASIASGGDDCDDTDADVYPGHPEICDGKDNDCNGQTDEGLSGQPCADPCPGTQSCVGGKWTPCDGRAPAAETCNGLDDDCNGFTDDGADCGEGKVCALGRCVPAPAGPDAGLPPGPDAGKPGPDAGAAPDAGSTPFTGGGCGCGAGGGPPLAWALFTLVLLRRRRPHTPSQ